MRNEALPRRTDLAVVLCAGASRRMGRPKGLLRLQGQPMLRHHLDVLETFSWRRWVVLGAAAPEHLPWIPPGVEVVVNPRWADETPIDSLRRVLAGASGPSPCPTPTTCLVTPVDVPPVTPDTLAALLEAGAPAVPTDPGGRPGHPVLLDRACIDAVLHTHPQEGLRTVLADAQRVPTDEALALDFDDPQAWRAFLAARGRGGG